MKIGIANDHRGVEVKRQLVSYLQQLGYETINYGTDTEVSVDYPQFAFHIGEAVSNHELDFGILLCGTGIGMCIACNKVSGVRCAKVNNEKECELTRLHNDANVLALSSEQDLEELKELVKIFLTTPFSKEERHIRRIKQIEEYEND